LSFFCDPFQFNPHSSSCNFHFSCFSLSLCSHLCSCRD
jgi:hypothetical protein